jgi:hypothetical protein
MGCFICKQLKTEYYEEEAGDCWVCMSINIGIASAITAAAVWLGLPRPAAMLAWGVMMFRVGYTGYLFPNTPQYLPYIDFLLEPLGTTPDEEEALKHMAEPVTEVCNDAHAEESDRKECVEELTDVVALRYRGELDTMEFLAAIGEITDTEPSELAENAGGLVEDDQPSYE